MKRTWTKACALDYCSKASKTETYGLKYWSARDYLKRFEAKEEVQDDEKRMAKA